MTIKECIDIVDNIKPNQYSIRDKVMWLSFLDEIIINEVLKTHEGYDERYDSFEGYTEDKLSVPLIVPSPYDRLYTAYLKMRIDGENGETARYNNSMAMYNTYMLEFRKHYNKTHMPLSTTQRQATLPKAKPSVGLSDAEYENLKKDMTYILTEYFSGTVSKDKLSSIVNEFVQNNIEMLKGRPGNDGHTPKKGVDYWTSADKAEVKRFIDEQTQILESDLEGIQKQIREEAHFRGYVSTNAEVQELPATPNDFVYSAESGTVWVYEAQHGWQETNTPVPDKGTPLSNKTPLMNGAATPGKSEEGA